MVQKMLSTLKDRAEGQMGSPLTTIYEIVVWLAVFVIGVIGAVLFVARRDGKKALAVGVAAVLVLLVLTLVFPPYWLRGVLVIALLGGLVWSWRQTAKA
jgi:CHASE2 domain-containing sensor protein